MSRAVEWLKRPQLWLTMAFAVVNMTLMLAIDGVFLAADTLGYEVAINDVLARGYNVFRTPGYPLLIALCHKFLGYELYHEGVVAVQVVVFLISVAVFWVLLKAVTQKNWIATIFGIFYSIAPGISTYTGSVLTESLTISFTIFLIASAYILLKGRATKATVAALFISLIVLLSLRPASLALMGSVGVLVVALFKKGRPYRYAVMVASAIAMLVPAYQYVRVYRTIGVATSSEVSLINRYLILYYENIQVSPDSTDNPKLRDLIVRLQKSGPHNPFYEIGCMLNSGCERAADSLLQRYHSPVIGFGRRTKDAICNYHLLMGYQICSPEGGYSDFMSNRTFFVAFRYWLVPLGIILGSIIFVLQWRRRRCVPWFTLFLISMVSAVALTAVLYGPDSYDRLTLPGIPALLLLYAMPFGKEILIPPYTDNILKQDKS